MSKKTIRQSPSGVPLDVLTPSTANPPDPNKYLSETGSYTKPTFDALRACFFSCLPAQNTEWSALNFFRALVVGGNVDPGYEVLVNSSDPDATEPTLIKVLEPGRYLIIHSVAQYDVTEDDEPLAVGSSTGGNIALFAPPTSVSQYAYAYSGIIQAGDVTSVSWSGSCVVDITDPPNQLIAIQVDRLSTSVNANISIVKL